MLIDAKCSFWRFDDILTFMSVMEAGSVTSGAARLKMSKS